MPDTEKAHVEWLTPAAVARRWDVSIWCIYQMAKDGRIPAHRLPGSNRLRFRADELDAVMAA